MQTPPGVDREELMDETNAATEREWRPGHDDGVGAACSYRLAICDNSATMSAISAEMAGPSGLEVVVLKTGAKAIALAESGDIDIVITSSELPDMSGAELCWLLKSIHGRRLPYVILASSDSIAARHIAALDAGADDSMRRPFEMAELQARLRVAQRTLNLLDSLHAMAMHDPLTGLRNRRAFEDSLLAEGQRARRHDRPLSAIACDLDRFKRVNDRFGHLAGDEVLQKFAGILQDVTRSEDVPARLGGEEFVVLLPDTKLAEAAILAERVRSTLARTKIRLSTGQTITATGSFGVADLRLGLSCQADTKRAAEIMLSAADRACYRAKAGGRNLVLLAADDDLPSGSKKVAAA